VDRCAKTEMKKKQIHNTVGRRFDNIYTAYTLYAFSMNERQTGQLSSAPRRVFAQEMQQQTWPHGASSVSFGPSKQMTHSLSVWLGTIAQPAGSSGATEGLGGPGPKHFPQLGVSASFTCAHLSHFHVLASGLDAPAHSVGNPSGTLATLRFGFGAGTV
jgi:hypothetical protein